MITAIGRSADATKPHITKRWFERFVSDQGTKVHSFDSNLHFFFALT